MSTERRRQAREAFARLAELPEEQRAAELRRLGAADERLRADVEALLHAESILGVEGVAETDAGGQAAESEAGPTASTPAASQELTRDANFPEQAGSQIGRYKLLQQIGEGGFGVVFLAEQERPVRRRVAVKIIKLGMDTRQVVARFEQERQALALMDHPNIA